MPAMDNSELDTQRSLGALTAEMVLMRASFSEIKSELRELRYQITQATSETARQAEEFARVKNTGRGMLIGVALISGGIGSILPFKLSKLLGLG